MSPKRIAAKADRPKRPLLDSSTEIKDEFVAFNLKSSKASKLKHVGKHNLIDAKMFLKKNEDDNMHG